jgi:UDP-glucose 4-epimerase
VIAIFADRLARGEPVEIFGDGQQVRDFIHVSDAVRALGRALRAASTGASVFNVCTGMGTTVQALAEMIAALYRTELVAYHRSARSGEVRVSVGDPRQAVKQLGFEAKTALADGLAISLNLPGPRSVINLAD